VNSVTATLTITVSFQSAARLPSDAGQLAGFYAAAFLPVPALALLALSLDGGMSTTRKRRLWLLCGLLLSFLALQAGCGGGSGGQQTQPQSYIVAVTGASGAITHTAQVTDTVQ